MTEPTSWEHERKYVLDRLEADRMLLTQIREEQIQTRIFVGVHQEGKDIQADKAKTEAARLSLWFGSLAGAVVGALVSIAIAVFSK